jgi:hypothetical protein
MRSFDGKPAPTPQEQAALLRMIMCVTDALSELHDRKPKSKNIEPGWVPPEGWTPGDEGAERDDEGERAKRS